MVDPELDTKIDKVFLKIIANNIAYSWAIKSKDNSNLSIEIVSDNPNEIKKEVQR